MRDDPILIVEDSPEDREVAVRALRAAGLDAPIVCLEDGDEALDYLFRRGSYSDVACSPRPGIVLLDLNLPGTDGRDVLREIKSDVDLRQLPVIVLTTSADRRDVEGCYRSGANAYVQKPIGLDAYRRAVASLKSFWFESALLPPEPQA